jgi:hypothetical protein
MRKADIVNSNNTATLHSRRRITMKTLFRYKIFNTALTALVLVTSGIGCGDEKGVPVDIIDYCGLIAQCEGGNDMDEKACVEDAKGDRSENAVYNCGEKYDQWLECEVDQGHCYYDEDLEDDIYGDDGKCDGTEDALSECIRNASAWD